MKEEELTKTEKIEYYVVLSVVLLSILTFIIYNWVKSDKLVDEYYQQVIKNEIIK